MRGGGFQQRQIQTGQYLLHPLGDLCSPGVSFLRLLEKAIQRKGFRHAAVKEAVAGVYFILPQGVANTHHSGKLAVRVEMLADDLIHSTIRAACQGQLPALRVNQSQPIARG